MDKRVRERLLKIFDDVPLIKEILISKEDIEDKRKKIADQLNTMLIATFDDDPSIPPLKWVLRMEAIRVFRKFLSRRGEKLAGYSFLNYIHNIINEKDQKGLEKPSPDFYAELEHLVRGVSGKAEVYPKKIPAFVKHSGEQAARLRSKDLSQMAEKADEFLNRYPTGLDKEVKRKRSQNSQRILNYFNATEYEWGKWKWHTRHIIKDADTLKALVKLTEEEYEAVKLANKNKIPFGITPYYLSLMDYDPSRKYDYAVRAQVIPSLHYIKKYKEFEESKDISMDFMLERDTSPIEGITRRYPKIVILKPILTCPQICVYCQRNWEIEDVYSKHAVLSKEKLEKALQWISDTPEVTEVLITGGDPLLLSNAKLENMLFKLSRIEHVKRIRIGTRIPVTLPQRITDSLIKDINHFHHPGKREILIITHFEHPYEISSLSMQAIQKFRQSGIEVYNQLVYTFYNSRKFEAAALRDQLRLIGVTPYYTFNTKGKEETDDFRVPVARLLQEQKEEARLMPGSVRTDEVVFNVPGLGKNYLRATQHHDVISILPDGRRVYEFHPWEKKLSLADTYIYTDVSISRYLQRLKAGGENIADYKSIWYYY
jgi:lysine 2,3-aminomutase